MRRGYGLWVRLKTEEHSNIIRKNIFPSFLTTESLNEIYLKIAIFALVFRFHGTWNNNIQLAFKWNEE